MPMLIDVGVLSYQHYTTCSLCLDARARESQDIRHRWVRRGTYGNLDGVVQSKYSQMGM